VPLLTTHLGKCQRSATGLGRCPHDLGDEGLRSWHCASAAITNAAKSRAEIESIVVRHGPHNCAAHPLIQVQTMGPRITALKNLRSSVRRTSRERQ
jgi:hypothetical protein